MATITEDYVSFEVAKLLKEKGFDEECSRWYVGTEPQEGLVVSGFGENQFYINAPTLQMAMKWLREVHNIFIEPKISKNTFLWGYRVSISNGSTSCLHANTFNKYEEACEAAIKYSLENLI